MTRIRAIATESLNLWAEKRYLSFSKAWRVLVRIPTLLANLPAQYAVFQALSSCKMRALTFRQPVLPFKYLRENYLLRGLTISARATALIYNYRYLRDMLRDDLLSKVLYDRVALYEMLEENHRYVVDLNISSPCYNEGELSLSFKMDDLTLYLLSFTFVPGEIVGIDAPTVILVSRLQGTYGCYPQIRAAMRALKGLALPMFLVVVLEGIAEALNIQHFAGIAGSNQHKYSDAKNSALQKIYDNFFTDLGATKNVSGFFCTTFPLQEKPLKLVNSCNRSRSKIQRKLKRRVATDVSSFLREKRKGNRQGPIPIGNGHPRSLAHQQDTIHFPSLNPLGIQNRLKK